MSGCCNGCKHWSTGWVNRPEGIPESFRECNCHVGIARGPILPGWQYVDMLNGLQPDAALVWGFQPSGFGFVPPRAESGSLFTGPEFGCVHFAAKGSVTA
jgi:hypothetical protein